MRSTPPSLSTRERAALLQFMKQCTTCCHHSGHGITHDHARILPRNHTSVFYSHLILPAELCFVPQSAQDAGASGCWRCGHDPCCCQVQAKSCWSHQIRGRRWAGNIDNLGDDVGLQLPVEVSCCCSTGPAESARPCWWVCGVTCRALLVPPYVAALLIYTRHDADRQSPRCRPMQWRTMCIKRYKDLCSAGPTHSFYVCLSRCMQM